MGLSDPFLFEEDSQMTADNVDASGQSSRWKRVIKWVFLVFFGIFASAHLYALILIWSPPPATFLMAERAVSGQNIFKRWVPLEEISPHLVVAVIAAEDQRFCEHSGVDTEAVRKAYNEWREGEGLRGGSTITQQTAKNVFLWNGGGIIRKVPEAWMAYVIDSVWGKQRVMEVYLNVAEWGDGLFGADAAARVRFGKPASQLTRTEAAMLATVLPSPNKWRVDPPGPYVQKRTRRTLQQMRNVERDGLAKCVVE